MTAQRSEEGGGGGIGSAGSNGEEQAMNPLVAKLLRGEPLPQPQRGIRVSSTTGREPIFIDQFKLDLDRVLNIAKGPEHYCEQIQVFPRTFAIASCIIISDLCGQSGTLLGKLAAAGHTLWRGSKIWPKSIVTKCFQAKLYEFIHHNAWTEAELKPFVIQQEDEDD